MAAELADQTCSLSNMSLDLSERRHEAAIRHVALDEQPGRLRAKNRQFPSACAGAWSDSTARHASSV